MLFIFSNSSKTFLASRYTCTNDLTWQVHRATAFHQRYKRCATAVLLAAPNKTISYFILRSRECKVKIVRTRTNLVWRLSMRFLNGNFLFTLYFYVNQISWRRHANNIENSTWTEEGERKTEEGLWQPTAWAQVPKATSDMYFGRTEWTMLSATMSFFFSLNVKAYEWEPPDFEELSPFAKFELRSL